MSRRFGSSERYSVWVTFLISDHPYQKNNYHLCCIITALFRNQKNMRRGDDHEESLPITILFILEFTWGYEGRSSSSVWWFLIFSSHLIRYGDKIRQELMWKKRRKKRETDKKTGCRMAVTHKKRKEKYRMEVTEKKFSLSLLLRTKSLKKEDERRNRETEGRGYKKTRRKAKMMFDHKERSGWLMSHLTYSGLEWLKIVYHDNDNDDHEGCHHTTFYSLVW